MKTFDLKLVTATVNAYTTRVRETVLGSFQVRSTPASPEREVEELQAHREGSQDRHGLHHKHQLFLQPPYIKLPPPPPAFRTPCSPCAKRTTALRPRSGRPAGAPFPARCGRP